MEESVLGIVERVSQDLVRGCCCEPVDVVQAGVVIASVSPREDGEEFQFQIPPRMLDGAEHLLHFRTQNTGRFLRGSPLKIKSEAESARIPFHTTDWTGRRVLILAPHPDDEVLGCGGSILLHRQAGDEVEVIFLTDGRHGGDPEVRRAEAIAACSKLDVAGVDFWGYRDRELSTILDLPERIRSMLLERRPELIYCPSPWEYHPDHEAAARALLSATRLISELQYDILFCEIGCPIPVNTLVDTSEVWEAANRACLEYQSQLSKIPYHDFARGIHRFRAHTVSVQGTTACEGFFHRHSTELKRERLFGIPHGPCRLGAPQSEALISVIVRTQNNRPTLREALASLAAQTYSRLEVIVVNDGGEELQGKLEDFRSCFSELKVVDLECSHGRSYAANAGIEASHGAYCSLLDDDDLLFPDHISKLAGFLQVTGERFAYSDCERTWYDSRGGSCVEIAKKAPFHSKEYDLEELHLGNFIPSMCALFSRELWVEAGRFDSGLEAMEDWDLWLRMAGKSHLHHLPGVTAEYRTFRPCDPDYSASILKVYAKHIDYWTPERLASITSYKNRFRQLEAETNALQAHVSNLETELRLRNRPLWKKALARLARVLKSWSQS